MIQLPEAVLKYYARINAEVLNFRRGMVKIYRGSYYIERALIRIDNNGKIICTDKDLAPTEEEAAAIAAAWQGNSFPRAVGIKNTDSLRNSGKIKGEIYEFIDRRTGEICMVQERRVKPNGEKNYIPWVFMSDGQWMAMEPDGNLPFWKPKERRGPGARIMIHEGAKAAKAADEIAQGLKPDHPWTKELAEYEHWGMIGGALAPHRSEYAELRDEKPSEVVYVCDNDYPGRSALQKVSKAWGRPLKGISFGTAFPPSFDLADPLPEEMFTPSGRFLGPRLADLIEPATWATTQVPKPTGKGEATVLLSDFTEEWFHSVKPEVFIHKDWPSRLYTEGEFNSMVAPFSDSDDTARLLRKQHASKATILRYVPGEPSGISPSESGFYINTYCPSSIIAEKGNPTPFLDFLAYLVPGEEDRFELQRWLATLIARPDVRMMYGVLMISETQGIGKGTLGEKILAPLVGSENTSFPSEQDIVESAFNYWCAHKRLAVIHEIYAGQSSKAYNKLKNYITDKGITVNKKFQQNYTIENWIHIFACSNSSRAIKLSMDDRRWFVPKLTEERRDNSYWEKLNYWLTQQGGLNIIRWWAEDFVKTAGGAVESGAIAPWSSIKRTIVEESYSPGQILVNEVLQLVKSKIDKKELPRDTLIVDTMLIDLIKHQIYDGRHNEHLERPATIRALAKAQGWACSEAKVTTTAWSRESFGGRVIALTQELAEKAARDQRNYTPLNLLALLAL